MKKSRTNSQQAINHAAKATFSRGLMLPSTFRKSVGSTEISSETYSRCAFKIEHREVERHLQPAYGIRKAQLQAPPSPDSVNPWSVDLSNLKEETKVPTKCLVCDGNEKVSCYNCAGVGKVDCLVCNGSGEVPGKRGQKICPHCRGTTQKKCGQCVIGKVQCKTCDAQGKVFAWLEIHSSQSSGVTHDGKFAKQAHRNLDQVSNFERKSDFPGELLSDTGWVQGASIPSHLELQIDPKYERVVESRVQQFRLPVYKVHYSLLFQKGTIFVLGNKFHVSEKSDWLSLKVRRIITLMCGSAALLAALNIRETYLNQHEWFSLLGPKDALMCLSLLIGFFSWMFFAGVSLQKKARTRLRTLLPISFAVLSCVFFFLSITFIQPDFAEAAVLLQKGRLEESYITLEALLQQQPGDPSVQKLLDQVRLRKIQKEDDLERISAHINASWFSQDYKARALKIFSFHAENTIEREFQKRNPKAFGKIIQSIEPHLPILARKAKALQEVLLSELALEGRDYAQAVSHIKKATIHTSEELSEVSVKREQLIMRLENDAKNTFIKGQKSEALETKREEFSEAIDLLSLRSALTQDPTSTFNANKLHRLHKKNLTAIRSRERKIQRSEAKKRKRQQAKKQALQRRQKVQQYKAKRLSSPLLCRDGTLSPTCICGGSQRGCCSHHGGVRGCSDVY